MSANFGRRLYLKKVSNIPFYSTASSPFQPSAWHICVLQKLTNTWHYATSTRASLLLRTVTSWRAKSPEKSVQLCLLLLLSFRYQQWHDHALLVPSCQSLSTLRLTKSLNCSSSQGMEFRSRSPALSLLIHRAEGFETSSTSLTTTSSTVQCTPCFAAILCLQTWSHT